MRTMLLCLWLAVAPLSWADDRSPTRELTVSGQASRLLAPDIATISLEIQGRGATPAEAMALAGQRVGALIQALSGKVIAQQIRSNQVQLRSVVSGTERPWRRDGSEAMEMLASREIQIDRLALENLPEIMSILATLPLSKINHVSARPARADQVRDELLLLAIDDARARAQRMAQRLGVRLGLPLSVQSFGDSPEPMFATARTLSLDSEAQAGTGFEQSGQQRIEARVRIVFELQAP